MDHAVVVVEPLRNRKSHHQGAPLSIEAGVAPLGVDPVRQRHLELILAFRVGHDLQLPLAYVEVDVIGRLNRRHRPVEVDRNDKMTWPSRRRDIARHRVLSDVECASFHDLVL